MRSRPAGGNSVTAQVVVEVTKIIMHGTACEGRPWLDWTTFGGVTAGIAIMYATALLV